MAVDLNRLNVFVGQFVGDLGAAVHAGMVVIGEKLGLYKALANGPLDSIELAAKTKTDERAQLTFRGRSNRFSVLLPLFRGLSRPSAIARA
jgi:hypothetical protein